MGPALVSQRLPHLLEALCTPYRIMLPLCSEAENHAASRFWGWLKKLPAEGFELCDCLDVGAGQNLSRHRAQIFQQGVLFSLGIG